MSLEDEHTVERWLAACTDQFVPPATRMDADLDMVELFTRRPRDAARWAAMSVRLLADTLPRDDPWRRLRADGGAVHVDGLPAGVVLDGLDLVQPTPTTSLDAARDISTAHLADDLHPLAARILVYALGEVTLPTLTHRLMRVTEAMHEKPARSIFDAWLHCISPVILRLMARRREYHLPTGQWDLLAPPAQAARFIFNEGPLDGPLEVTRRLALPADAYAQRLDALRCVD